MSWFTASHIEWLAVILATIATFVVGFAWYHPRTLGPLWMRLVGLTEEEVRTAPPLRFVATGVVAFVTAIVLNVLMVELSVLSVGGGALFGAFLAFVMRAGSHVIHHGFELRPHTLTLVNGGHDIVALAVAGAIIGAFV
ncbi:DUF1761 domain-containing protein [Demequina lignilytica]|uniref:DUF1761 domain-containing protein n=1 Tax=Demequina lignilytica TaxID=3051663 RepID=A0AB35MHA4_9MICO|nr:DUF1761 domain-containing protein [Demequina sp. SYSU T0a273]MDN4483122.1 DUF1761 domain-containing protein [Demequina sp. SYSU T0a273]